MHSLEEVWALDGDHCDRLDDHTAPGFCTDHAALHVPHASGAISGYGPTGPYLRHRSAMDPIPRLRHGRILLSCCPEQGPDLRQTSASF